jgi:hypothetical protein
MSGSSGPLAALSDADLADSLLALELACGKAHGVLVEKRRGWFCLLFTTLKVERDLRGLPARTGTLHVGDLPRRNVA